jgi:putative FmdB family regulatory protein
MPTYDYVCDVCDHKFELFHSIKDEPKKKCPECGKNKLRRLIGTGAAIVFKGSGFYQTDYRSDSYRKAAEADKSPSSSSGGKSESKSETKPESKSADAKPAAPAKKPGKSSK